MNEDIFAGQWKQMRGELKSWWGRLADDDLDRIGGQKDRLVGLLQEKYGYALDQAKQEVERRFKEYTDKTDGTVANITAMAQEFGVTAASKANEAATVIGEKVTKVSDGVESVSSYLREIKVEDLKKNFTELVRTYPIQFLMISIGIGFLLARRVR